MIFIAGSILSGIGQVADKYRRLFGGSKLYTWTDDIPSGQDVCMYMLPLPNLFQTYCKIRHASKTCICMTICETETVHPYYGEMFKLFPRVVVPSKFCKDVFERQFSHVTCDIIHHWTHLPKSLPPVDTVDYTFYHIGNIADPRKQVKRIIEAFLRLNLPNTKLVLKATCKQPVIINLPRVEVINGLLPEERILDIHRRCDCYVSFSHSEGVGMGAVEAALLDKPVIISEYGGAKEYVHTPYVIPCTRKIIGKNDFLYTADMEWGDPDFTKLMEYMSDAYQKQLRAWDHSHTKELLSNEKIKSEFTEHSRLCNSRDT